MKQAKLINCKISPTNRTLIPVGPLFGLSTDPGDAYAAPAAWTRKVITIAHDSAVDPRVLVVTKTYRPR